MADPRKISSCSLHSSDHLYSQDSVLYALNRFLKTISNMNDTVLVPCKLHDVDEDQDEKSLTSMSSDDGVSSLTANLFDSYQMLNEAKEDLLWGTNGKQEINEASPTHQFKHHLTHLQQLLNQFSDVANQLTTKYQSETGSCEY